MGAISHQPGMDKSEKIFVAGYRGLVGSALIRRLERKGFSNLPKRDRAQLDFTNELAVRKFFLGEKPAGRGFRCGEAYDWFLKNPNC